MIQKDAMSQVVKDVEAVIAKDTTLETVVKEVEECVANDVDGKTVSLTCCAGWVWSLKIARATTVSSPPKTTGSA